VTLLLAAPLSEPGEYSFEVAVDDEVLTCTAYVPLRRDGTEPRCRGMSIDRRPTSTSGRSLTAAGDAITGILIGGEWDVVDLQVHRDGVEALTAEVTPEYRGVEVNGEGCGKCPRASHTIGGAT
jgi:hypothetical protein